MTTTVDQKNIAFWNELCGTGLAMQLGITDSEPANLKKFDDWYFDIYPYLITHVPFETVKGLDVLEIGLGYGTVAQRLMERGARYHGLDVADGPVAMARHRADLVGRSADIRQGSALAIPYGHNTFDGVVTIGCLHHTGNLALALTEVHRVLKPGGWATAMLYSALSYRHWMKAPLATFGRWRKPQFDWANAEPGIRKRYDANLAGEEAPSTTFISVSESKLFLSGYFSSVKVTPRNIGKDFPPAFFMSRPLANRCFEKLLGLDLYIECTK